MNKLDVRYFAGDMTAEVAGSASVKSAAMRIQKDLQKQSGTHGWMTWHEKTRDDGVMLFSIKHITGQDFAQYTMLGMERY